MVPRSVRLMEIALLITSLLISVALAEIALRLAGFRMASVPIVEVGWPDPKTIRDEFIPDHDLFWVTKDYEGILEVARQRRQDIIFMGDSCTQYGTYPRLTLERLVMRGSALQTAVKVGVAGWSSEQGVAQLERDVRPLRPRVITIYYGWNDHWVALGPPDHEARPKIGRWLFDRSRLAQLYVQWSLASSSPRQDRPNRVSLDRYRSNLRRIARLAAEAQIRTVFITAPSSHVRGQELPYLAERHLDHLSDLVPLHTSYVEATREVARETGVVLCDAAAAFTEQPNPIKDYFRADGIHLTASGDSLLAGLLADCVERAVGTPASAVSVEQGVR